MRTRYKDRPFEGPTRRHAREVGTNQASYERLLWSKLRRRNIGNSNFRRQHPLYGFITDFRCIEHHL